MSEKKKYDRIMIMGVSGSGKSTLARRLGEIMELEPIHLDQVLMNVNWTAKPKDEQAAIHEELVKADRWIIEGNWSHTLEERVERAQLILYLDCPLWVSLLRVTKRLIENWGDKRTDLAPGCYERFSPRFYWFIIKYYYTRRRYNIAWAREKRDTPLIFIDTSHRNWEKKIEHLLD